jgi:putative ABC transport system substrate-binding protein
MDRRSFVVGGLTALAAPLGAAAQPASRIHRIGVLSYLRPEELERALATFKRALSERGYVDGRHVAFELRTANGRFEALPDLAADLVRRQVDLILAIAPLAIRAARQATPTIPIVMIFGDPAMFASLARPGGNVTGLSALAAELAGKQVELLREAVPKIARVAVLRNPAQPVHTAKLQQAEIVARAAHVQLIVVDARTPEDFDAVFATMARERTEGLIVFADGMFRNERRRLLEHVTRLRLPAVYGSSGFAEAGGLIAYVPDASEAYTGAAAFVDKIFKGASPGTLPVEQPTKFELIVNLRAAKALGLTLAPALLLRAEQVID